MDDIVIPIDYYEDENGNKIIDEDCMREEFESKLDTIVYVNQTLKGV